MDINLASLVLEPAPTLAGFTPEDSVVLAAIPALVSNNVPLSRAPLAAGAPSITRRFPVSRFSSEDSEPIELPITGFFSVLARDSTSNALLPPYLALLSPLEGNDVGFVRFVSGPVLRLIINTAAVVGLR
jgi:hypothetical protein